ncbi:DUF3857 domain-containing protein [Flavobacterium sp. NRK1]|uniref:DUF3857 domain-containing protein n=1 Tax=Flavobacterium sp. NRK1 TaxID=2954929 RepID=UPI00209215DF|nr:DUF3857 domain-containing protein [Flavobacterium sp. NRK1]MCO6148529.1 DUF3857 domain-containing protein [Flavobacterium sp. NRK1]
MKTRFLIVLLYLYGCMANAQKKDEVQELFWGKDDAYKSAMTIPDKWKNESAVVIYKNENYDFHKFGTNITYTSSIRKRIKLQDQAAITEFSEFSFKDRFYSSRGFSLRKGTNIIGIKVVKPDGSEKIINVDEEAVKADDKKKIAIPNLEPGDILDYYYYAVEPFKMAAEYGFEPEENTLGDTYPIMDLKLTFTTENDFFVNFNTYNGAPELKQIQTKGGDRKYELIATDIDKNDFPRWFYPLAELPCYKFQVYFARNGNFEARATAFLPEKESIIKKTVSETDVFNYYEKKFKPFGDLGDIFKFLKGKTFKNDEEKVREVYYYMRHQYYTRYVEAFVIKEANIMYPFDLYGNYPIFFNTEIQFINHFMAFLKDYKIDYDIIIATPRGNGPIKDLLIENNAAVMLKVNTENPVYVHFFNPYTNADQISYSVENSDAYALHVVKRKKVSDIETIKLPSSTYKDNQTVGKVSVSIDPDFASLKIEKESSLYGHNKDTEQPDKMYFFDYVTEDYDKYGTEPLLNLVKSKKRREQYTNEFDALKNKLKEKQKEEFKKSTEAEFGFEIDDHSLSITNTGRFGKSTPFSFNENFTVKNNLLKKAGTNYVFEIGKLIGQQAEIEEKENKRTNNIYMAFPRSFKNEIVFTIPDGYTVSGLDKLNKKVENTTGGFESSAKIEGNKLIVNTYKYYANYFEPNANWKNMVDFLDAAYQFTQEKVLLKKS